MPLGQGAINRWSARHVRGWVQTQSVDHSWRFAAADGDGQAETSSASYPPIGRRQLPRAGHHLPHKFFLTFFGNFLDAIGPLIVLAVGGWLVMRGSVRGRDARGLHLRLPEAGRPWDQLTNFYRMLSTAHVKYKLIADTLPTESADRA